MINAAILWDPFDTHPTGEPRLLAGQQAIWVSRDIFAPDVSDQRIIDTYAKMLDANRHTFLLASDNTERMAKLTYSPEFVEAVRQALHKRTGDTLYLVTNGWWAEQNVWLGVRARDQQQLDDRVHHLINTRASARFLDCRALRGPLDLNAAIFGEQHAWQGEHPNIAGMNTLCFIDGLGYGIDLLYAGEAPDLDWVRSLRDQCVEGGTAFNYTHGKLDGRTWSERPKLLDLD